MFKKKKQTINSLLKGNILNEGPRKKEEKKKQTHYTIAYHLLKTAVMNAHQQSSGRVSPELPRVQLFCS